MARRARADHGMSSLGGAVVIAVAAAVRWGLVSKVMWRLRLGAQTAL